ncbi:MAG: cytochrome c, partial [Methyloligellaceae bacterium]
EASPKIWQDMQGFLAKAEDLKTASAKARDAASQGQDAFKAVLFADLVKACKGCHDAYRIKKKK